MSTRYAFGGDHPLIGCSAPDFEFEDGTRLGGLLNEGKGLLLDFADNTMLEGLVQPFSSRLKYVSTKVRDNKGLNALLVRPDGFVAWLSESEIDIDAAKTSINRWFGCTS